MKRFFFLPSEVSWSIITVCLYSFIKWSFVASILLALIGLCFLLLFRRKLIPYRDTQKMNGELFLSPIHGIVQSVRLFIDTIDYPLQCHEIRISLPLWNEKGLYLPTSGEVIYLKANKGKKISRDSSSEFFYGPMDEISHTDLTLVSKNKTQSLMRFIDCQSGIRPSIWLKSGDRGRAGACFGYYPFGGSLLIYVPASSDILVYEGERVTPGLSVVASLKDQPKV
jgi:hypothetical protein